ncbi:hypothetical protein RSP822_12095 [Ralstonia solanacearum]|nr:hypothetical protein RSP822_12095 [Ralstonia solanacearum]
MVWLACLNLSGVVVGMVPRATMRVAPDGPKNRRGFESRFFCQVVRQAGVPFTSSYFSGRKTRGVVLGKTGGWRMLRLVRRPPLS